MPTYINTDYTHMHTLNLVPLGLMIGIGVSMRNSNGEKKRNTIWVSKVQEKTVPLLIGLTIKKNLAAN